MTFAKLRPFTDGEAVALLAREIAVSAYPAGCNCPRQTSRCGYCRTLSSAQKRVARIIARLDKTKGR